MKPSELLGWGDAYCYFEYFPTIEEAIREAQKDWITKTGDKTPDSLSKVTEHMYAVLDDYVSRHNTPWASPGIKKILESLGVPTTQIGVFTEFINTKPKSYWLDLVIKEQGVRKLSHKIANAELFDDCYTGNFSGFSPIVISRALNRYLGYT